MIHIPSERVVQWMNCLRENPNDRDRVLENFWASQIRSKTWLVNQVQAEFGPIFGNAFVFGGWYGVLATMIADNFGVECVYSIDNDPNCAIVGKKMVGNDPRIIFVTHDMKDFSDNEYFVLSTYPALSTPVALIINTSAEHISQEVYDEWLRSVPVNVPLVVQGNDYFACDEHVRCSRSLGHFIEQSGITNIVYSGELQCNPFKRFMIIGEKV